MILDIYSCIANCQPGNDISNIFTIIKVGFFAGPSSMPVIAESAHFGATRMMFDLIFTELYVHSSISEPGIQYSGWDTLSLN